MTSAPESRRPLGWFDISCLGLNCVIGSGIFLAPGLIAAKLGPYAPLAFAAAALLCLTVGLCFAEMASRYPGTGGAYLYARHAFGLRAGFSVGWVMWLSGLIGGASVAVGLGELVARTFDESSFELPVAVCVVVLLAVVNYSGARGGAWTNDLLAVAKLTPLLVLVGWGLTRVSPTALLWPAVPVTADFQWAGFLLVLYTFSGFEEIALPAGEVRNARRNVPIAILLTLVVVTGVYVVIQGMVSNLPGQGEGPPLLRITAGTPWLNQMLVLGGLASLASINAAIAFTCPRSLWALAHDGWLPAPLRALHPRFGSPSLCVGVCCFLTLLLVISGTLEHLVRLSVLVSLLQYIATVAAVLRLGRGRLPLVVPLAALCVCVLLLVTSDPLDVAATGAALVVGLVFAAGRGARIPR